MSHTKLAVAFGLILTASPLMAQSPDSMGGAPAAGPDARYCMRVEPATGTLVEVVLCWTRDQWADQGVDVDKDWAKEGVSIKEDGATRRRT